MFRPRGPDDGGIADVEFSKENTITSRTLTLADYETLVATELAVNDWKSVDQAQVNQFGKASWHTYWMHTDPKRAAAEGPCGGTLAHGF